MTRLWIDTDMGVDDVLAIVAMRAHRAVDGISLVSGNAPLTQVAQNAGNCVTELGWDVPVYHGADRPVLGPLETAQAILGADGLPARGEGPVFTKDSPYDFPHFLGPLCDWLEEDGPHEILALGPLTNLAILALARPDLLPRIDRLVWMGGAVGRGNHTPSAEFNAFADPEAVQIVLDRGVMPDVIDLDACREVQIGSADVDALAGATTPRARILHRLLGGYLDIGLSRGRPGMALYDPVAAAAMIAPENFTFEDARVRMACTDPVTRGRTETDFQSQTPNARFATDLDADAIRTLCLAPLALD
ncbi:nucleoside hydrolase [Litoreibacter arenae]|uniref:Inosine-uridine preferring nucleoside hydrolase n=1 Tax=Litoreibacter arenae DSM 19593 TaxID=1123360 RepID=S9RMS3_9RHOB|nr:nucleoside hydrolase [Litoreibacter arenae]EPX79410.1 Inosine-uridine preferring nucleoside hydrolase [Litoreibacter arenae DSM 19593]